MEIKEIPPADAKSKASELLPKLCCVTLATTRADGYPNSRLLVLGAADGTETLWFSTSIASKKIAEIKANAKVSVYGCDMESFTEIRLFGTVEILTDMDSRKKVWKDDYTQYWPEGIASPDMAVLKFTTLRGEFSSMSEKGTF